MKDPDQGEVALFRLHLPHDGVKEFTVPATAVASKEELKKYLSHNGVVATQKQYELLTLFVIAMLALGTGNGAVFQLVPQRFGKEIGILTGLVGMAGGIGGFYLASSLGLARQQGGSGRGDAPGDGRAPRHRAEFLATDSRQHS